MALVDGAEIPFCIDRWEASLLHVAATGEREPWPGNQPVDGKEHEMVATTKQGNHPQGFISGAQAELACARADKRLCTLEEWRRACRGRNDTAYPYGAERRPNLCNDRFQGLEGHPVDVLFRRTAPPGADPESKWSTRSMNDPRLHELPRSVAATGTFPECVNDYGVFDMVGNLHEWVADRAGTFAGGFFMDTFRNGEGCEYATTAHDYDYHDYSTGFRCCRAVLHTGTPEPDANGA